MLVSANNIVGGETTKRLSANVYKMAHVLFAVLHQLHAAPCCAAVIRDEAKHINARGHQGWRCATRPFNAGEPCLRTRAAIRKLKNEAVRLS